jgi:HD-GYP domain-containing protein (c-di-GMP phosphodiesterase class II)
MGSPVILLGDVPAEDFAVLYEAASRKDLEVIIASENGSEEITESTLPKAFISFLPCTEPVLLDLFATQPIGFGEKIPYFQRIESPDIPKFLDTYPLYGVFRSPLDRTAALSMMNCICQNTRVLDQNQNLIGEIIKFRRQKSQLIQIGTSLSIENDLGRLLELILRISRDIVSADAGSVYVCEQSAKNGAVLRFKVAQNDSVDTGKEREFTIPVDEHSIAGYVAATGRLLTIDDVNALDASVPYQHSKNSEKRFGYRVKSMMTLPLRNLDNEVVGVLQLMNKKSGRNVKLSTFDDVERSVVPFMLSDEDILLSIASYAAVSIERAQLYESIRLLFEGFLSSSIAAIDERDRVTSGHSKRVMGYAKAFIEAAQHDAEGPFWALAASEDRRRQFQFAALLHDIGKIGVPEYLLNKECRLDQGTFAALMTRMDFISVTIDKKESAWSSAGDLEKDRALLRKVNTAGFLPDTDVQELALLKEKWYTGLDGRKSPLLSTREFEALSVRAGNLTSQEREIMNSHAQSTYRILSKIPWTRQLADIPVIACSHHERLDGSGYPRGLHGEQIALESRILAVIDIYEALVAQDRPYKPKMPPEKALDILHQEVERGHLDSTIVRFFIERGIYKLYLENAS